MLSPGRQATQPGSKFVEPRLDFARQRLTKDLAMLGLGRTPVEGSPAFKTSDQLIIEIAYL